MFTFTSPAHKQCANIFVLFSYRRSRLCQRESPLKTTSDTTSLPSELRLSKLINSPKLPADKLSHLVTMSTASSPQTTSKHSLPANLLLSSREFRQYRRWQGLFPSAQTSEDGRVTTALQYNDFRLWLAKQDSGYFSDVFEDIAEHLTPRCSIPIPAQHVPFATICRHVMHPAVCASRWTRCPSCTIDLHLVYVKAVTSPLKKAAGRPLPGTGTPSEHQEILFRAWTQAKLEAVHQLAELEDLAAKEEKWAERNEAIQCEGMKTAQEAVQKYWAETTGFELIHRQNNRNKRSVEFAADTRYEPGRDSYYFWRRSPRYSPGKHSILDAGEEEDQDISQDSEDYSAPSTLIAGYCNIKVEGDSLNGEKAITQGTITMEAESDGDDSDWTDVESDYGDESSDSSYICFEIEEEAAYITFSDE